MKRNPTFVKYPEIPHLMECPQILDSDNVQVFEKIDGGNTQVRTSEGRILTGSRANFLEREERFKFDWFKDFNRWAKSNQSLYGIPENLIVYGEFTSFHTISYKPKFTNKFFLIDVYDTDNARFIPYLDARERLEKSGVEDILFLEPLAEGKLGLKELRDLAKGRSQYSRSGREGVVIKDYGAQKFAKFWRTSANPTQEGLMEEIKKTITSLATHGENSLVNLNLEHLDKFPGGLVSQVYQELRRSGRTEISLAEISNTIRMITKKI